MTNEQNRDLREMLNGKGWEAFAEYLEMRSDSLEKEIVALSPIKDAEGILHRQGMLMEIRSMPTQLGAMLEQKA